MYNALNTARSGSASNGCSLVRYLLLFQSGPSVKILIELSLGVRYAQRHETSGFFINKTTVLPVFVLVRDHTVGLFGPEKPILQPGTI